MKYIELKDKPSLELKRLLKSEQEKLRGLRFKVAAKQLKNIRDVRVTKRTIARILTILNQKKEKTNE